MSGKQIKLFLVDGTPGGLTTAEITNWTIRRRAPGTGAAADFVQGDVIHRATADEREKRGGEHDVCGELVGGGELH